MRASVQQKAGIAGLCEASGGEAINTNKQGCKPLIRPITLVWYHCGREPALVTGGERGGGDRDVATPYCVYDMTGKSRRAAQGEVWGARNCGQQPHAVCEWAGLSVSSRAGNSDVSKQCAAMRGDADNEKKKVRRVGALK